MAAVQEGDSCDEESAEDTEEGDTYDEDLESEDPETESEDDDYGEGYSTLMLKTT